MTARAPTRGRRGGHRAARDDPPRLASAEALRARGAAVIYDIDDLLTALPPHISNQAKVQAQQTQLRRCLQAADLVTVSTERLGRELAVPATAIVPNYGDLLPPVDAPVTPPAEPLAAGFILASSDRVPVAQLALALRELQSRLGASGRLAGPLAAAGLDLGRVRPCPCRGRASSSLTARCPTRSR